MNKELAALPSKGTYTLVISVKADTHIELCKTGLVRIQKGYYAYTGSALGAGATGLRRRIMRHLRNRKTRHWHVDFLLANKHATVTSVVAANSDAKNECVVNQALQNIKGSTVPIVGFGASDCRQKCRSHLIFMGSENSQKNIVDAYKTLFGQNRVFNLALQE